MIKANFWQDSFAPQSYRRTWLFIVLSNVLELAIPILCAALINSAIPNENGTMAAILLISAALSGFFLSYLSLQTYWDKNPLTIRRRFVFR